MNLLFCPESVCGGSPATIEVRHSVYSRGEGAYIEFFIYIPRTSLKMRTSDYAVAGENLHPDWGCLCGKARRGRVEVPLTGTTRKEIQLSAKEAIRTTTKEIWENLKGYFQQALMETTEQC